MTATRVKICGLTRTEDRDRAVAAGADALGVISDVPVETPREVSPQRASDLVAGVPPLVTSVLVTMPDSPDQAVELQRRVGADAVQVHGMLSPAAVAELVASVEVPVIVAVDVETTDVAAYAESAAAVLVDSSSADGGGGTGQVHDWDRTREIRDSLDVPLLLAGGLTPENVETAIRTVRPFGVDTASGVETTGGQKDHEAVGQFVDRARGVEGPA